MSAPSLTAVLEASPGTRRPVIRVLLAVFWAVALAVWIFSVAGQIGFSPLDEGYIDSQAFRIIHGQVPHRDFISPRPVGSAFVHVIDLLVPLARFPASRFISVVQVVSYSFLFAALIYRRVPWRWNPLQMLGAGGATLVNLQAFPLMTWYTIDGLTFLALGLALVEFGNPQRNWVRRMGLICLGSAVVMKQSFFLAPLIGVVAALTMGKKTARRNIKDVIGAALLAGLPALIYVGFVTAFGGLGPMWTQLLGGRPVWGETLIAAFRTDPARSVLINDLRLLGMLAIAISAMRMVQKRWLRNQGARALLIARVAVGGWFSYLVVKISTGENLAYLGTWGLRLVWLLALIILIRAVFELRVDGTGILLLAVAWMTMLSWGYGVPNLVGGTIALFLIDRGLENLELNIGALRAIFLPLTAGAVAGALLVANVFVDTRKRFPYFDRPEPLTFSLRSASPEFGSIRTNPRTGRYLSDLVSCVRRHNARWVGVLPENAGLYSALGLRNPFPIDWIFPQDYVGSEQRFLEAARKLDREGDYLVLFQTVTAFEIPGLTDLVPATPTSKLFMYDNLPLAQEILNSLHGERIACGTFVGVRSPKKSSRLKILG